MLTGDTAMQAMRQAVADRGGATTLRLCCTDACGFGGPCHGNTIERWMHAALATEEEEAKAAAEGDARKRQRKPHSDKSKQRGPRPATADRASRIGYVSLLRFQHGGSRQVPEAFCERRRWRRSGEAQCRGSRGGRRATTRREGAMRAAAAEA